MLFRNMKTEVLSQNQILRICNRFAFQIIENNLKNEDILLVGIKEKGFEIAKLVMKEIQLISTKKVILKYIELDKKKPNGNIKSDLENKDNFNNVFLIDDVLNTGKTLIFSITYLLKFDFNSIKTLVLIDRNHKQYPVKIDFKGISLSTNINDNVSLVKNANELKAVLF